MKRISGFLLLSIFLAGCANVTPPPSPTETITGTPTLASTDTPQPTLTATPDPLANAPKGTTGFNENGDPIMDAEDGYRYFYFDTTAKQEAYWARPLIENYYAYDHWDFNAIPVDAWVKYGALGAEKITGMSHNDVKKFENKSSVMTHLTKVLLERLKSSSVDEFESDLKNGEISYDFVFNGKTIKSSFGKNGGYTVTFVNVEELQALHKDEMAVEAQGPYGTQSLIYLTVDGVKDGRVLFRVASTVPLDKLLKSSPSGDTEYGFRFLFYWPLANLLVPDADLLHVNNLTRASLIAQDSALPSPSTGEKDLQVIITP